MFIIVLICDCFVERFSQPNFILVSPSMCSFYELNTCITLIQLRDLIKGHLNMGINKVELFTCNHQRCLSTYFQNWTKLAAKANYYFIISLSFMTEQNQINYKCSLYLIAINVHLKRKKKDQQDHIYKTVSQHYHNRRTTF